MIVLDTTVLIYAVGGDHPMQAPCDRIMGLIEQGLLAGTTSAEVIQGFAHVRARRRGREDAARLARAYADLLTPLLVIKETDLREGLGLFELHPALGSLDAILAAAARSMDAEALVSADAAFGAIPELNHVVPDDKGVHWLTER